MAPRAAGVATALKHPRTVQRHPQDFGLSVCLRHISGLGARATWARDAWHTEAPQGSALRGPSATGWVKTTSALIRRWQRCGRNGFAQQAGRLDCATLQSQTPSVWPRPRAQPSKRRTRHTRRRRSYPRPRRCPLRSEPPAH